MRTLLGPINIHLVELFCRTTSKVDGQNNLFFGQLPKLSDKIIVLRLFCPTTLEVVGQNNFTLEDAQQNNFIG